MALSAMPGVHRRRVFEPPDAVSVRGVRTVGDERTVVLVEQEPRLRKTKWDLGGMARDKVLSVPRLLFAIVFWRGHWEKTYVFVLRRPYAGPETMLHHLPLPNIFQSGKVCMGNEHELHQLTQETKLVSGWERKAAVVVRHFWNSHFNNHLIADFLANGAAIHPSLASIATWERASRAGPGFIEHCNWVPLAPLHNQAFGD